MNELRKLVIACFGLATSMVFTYLGLTKGWGLEMRSWGWFIGCTFFGQIFAQLIVMLATHKEK